MPNMSFSGIQKLAALSIITLVALIFASHFQHGDADGTGTGTAVNAVTFSGNGGSAFSDDCQKAATDQDAAKCAQQDVGALATQVGHNKIAINFSWTLI